MFEKMLKEVYGLKDGQELDVGRFRAFKQDHSLYLIMKANGRKEQEISELGRISAQLQAFGDKEVPGFVPTSDGKQFCEWEGVYYSVLKCRELRMLNPATIGRKLARFHLRGRYMPFQVENVNRIGQWKQLWEKRLDQMEKVWNEKLFNEPENEFERMFLDSFPYYMGLAENAIQYLADTELDGTPVETDGGTVCHERFTRKTWGRDHLVKNPFDWVFDHASRDLAEWTRQQYFSNIKTCQPAVKSFFADYRKVTRLSPFAWRLLYARLLYPLHYIECIENYYISTSEEAKRSLEDRLEKYLKQTAEHEQFLGSFYQLAEVPVRSYRLPVINWLLK
ncbi:spore coat putative kinase YutH [Mesobacillus foraminis]|uniref:spore coat putative kinase YutH n=1 Tax=Mesobacillus foraminis TaxID=279826 RepID=UPI00399F122B